MQSHNQATDVAATSESAALLRRVAERPSRLQSNLALTRELAVTSFKLKYSGSVLGYVWSMIKPILLFGMLYLVFAEFLLRGRTTPGDNFPVDLLIGIVLWTFFSDATYSSLFAVVSNADMLRKSYFPRWILVWAATASAAMTLAVNLVIVLALGLALHWYAIGWQTLWLPALLVELYALSLGVGFLLAALFVYYRDLGHIWDILLQLLFYLSAIVFPLTLIPVKYQPLAVLNPIAQLIEDVRRALVSPSLPWSTDLLGAKLAVPLLAVALSLAIGTVGFSRLSHRFGERL